MLSGERIRRLGAHRRRRVIEQRDDLRRQVGALQAAEPSHRRDPNSWVDSVDESREQWSNSVRTRAARILGHE